MCLNSVILTQPVSGCIRTVRLTNVKSSTGKICIGLCIRYLKHTVSDSCNIHTAKQIISIHLCMLLQVDVQVKSGLSHSVEAIT